MAGDGGLHIIDITDPTRPQRVGSYDTGDYALDVAVAGDYAFVACGLAGLQVIDISNPANPVPVANYQYPTGLGGRLTRITVSGEYACLSSDWEGSLQIVDISDPANPELAGEYDIASPFGRAEVTDGTVSGGYEYLSSASSGANGVRLSGLLALGLSNPENPAAVGFVDIGPGAHGIAVSGRYAFVAAEYAGLLVIDVSDPTSPQRVGVNTPFSATSVTVRGDHVYVAGRADGLIILNKFTELRFGPASVEADGMIRLPVNGASGQRVKLQRSSNLVDWIRTDCGWSSWPGTSQTQPEVF